VLRRVELDETSATIAATNFLSTDNRDISDSEISALAGWTRNMAVRDAKLDGATASYQISYAPKYEKQTTTAPKKVRVGSFTVTQQKKTTVQKFKGPASFSVSPREEELDVYFWWLDPKSGCKTDDVEVDQDGVGLLPSSGQVLVQMTRPGYESALRLLNLDRSFKQRVNLNAAGIRVGIAVDDQHPSIASRLEGAFAADGRLRIAPPDSFETLRQEVNNKTAALNKPLAVEALAAKLRRVRMDYQLSIHSGDSLP
jgi:hypothetical protein